MSRAVSPLRRELRWFLHVGVVALLLAALSTGCAVLDLHQRAWIFQPSNESWGTSALAARGLEDVWIDFDSAQDRKPARLHGLLVEQGGGSPAPLLLYLHGAHFNVASSAQRMRRLGGLGFAVLGIDYRGFGRSSPGLPSEALACEDARAAWDWLGERFPGRPRYLYGHSLGGAIATELAARVDDVAGLIVESSFTSIPDVVSTFRWGWLPLAPFITQRFDAAAAMASVEAPVIVLHGSDDALIPAALGHALYERARGPKRWILVAGGSHHTANVLGAAQVQEAMHELFGLRVPQSPSVTADAAS
jgi:alpha-beta hydrolase superfamily lysophospholipase